MFKKKKKKRNFFKSQIDLLYPFLFYCLEKKKYVNMKTTVIGTNELYTLGIFRQKQLRWMNFLKRQKNMCFGSFLKGQKNR